MEITEEQKMIEVLEKKYLDNFEAFLVKNRQWFLDRLKSKNEIKKDWLKSFKETCRRNYENSSELDTGAERVIHNLFGRYSEESVSKSNEYKKLLAVNSCPIGSDLMFETDEALIHIEVKTATVSNKSDFGGKIQISKNQTTYSVDKIATGRAYKFKPSLPTIYSNNKICLTYVIQIIHKNEEDLPQIIFLLCIPNGLLSSIYKDENCALAGKQTKKLNRLGSRGDIRFFYKNAQRFETLEGKPSRIKVIHPYSYTKELLKKFLGVESIEP
ncbi:MAG: hypothetical protein N3F07_01615 [Candidatus Micrarchaeota archaeon]|nr:hypothetical protein [Candidatus Micrarchaeota archaeon]